MLNKYQIVFSVMLLAIILISVWAVAIFGFQTLLKILEKPTPEVAYVEYEKVRENIKNGKASKTEYQSFIKRECTGSIKYRDQIHL